jgi:aryl-alcohol dehydrogenase-like predicted oxidoreductase
MQYFKLDQSTIVSRLSFGCEQLGGTDWGDDINVDEISEAVRHALESGVNFFDTADVYGLGLSEIRISNILAEKRHEVVIATKGGVSWKKKSDGRAEIRIDTSPKYIRSALEGSLKRLRVERIHVYYVHWPERERDVGPAVEALYELQNANKIGVIGCSNFSPEQLRRALEFAPIRLLQIPVNILFNRPTSEMMDICLKNGVGIVGYNTLASGLLTGKFTVNTTFPSNDRRSRLPQFIGSGLNRSVDRVEVLRKKAKCEGLSLAQYSIKRALNEHAVEATIIGIKQCIQLKENILAFT